MQISPAVLSQCWFLAGPTASGKSAVALQLAEQLSGEIIGMDSMTLYRGMDIGTAKPSVAERERVPHHLFDLLEPADEFSVADYLVSADRTIRNVLARGKVPLFVGGTGLYLRSLLRGVFPGPPADDAIRQRLSAERQRIGPLELHARLRDIDPVTAARISANDERRVIRALEVFELTGQPLSAQHQQAALPEDERPRHVYWLSPPRVWLHDRINQRVQRMFEQGLVEEVTRLLHRPGGIGKTARQALGYKEILDLLEAEKQDLSAAIPVIQTRTRQFAKRQHTWFRNLVECYEIPVQANDTPPSILERLQRTAALRK